MSREGGAHELRVTEIHTTLVDHGRLSTFGHWKAEESSGNMIEYYVHSFLIKEPNKRPSPAMVHMVVPGSASSSL